MPTENMNIKITLQNTAKKGIKGLSKDLRKVDSSAAKAAKGMKGLYVQLTGVAALLASGALFGSSIKIFADFDDNMRAAGAVTSATADEMEKMTAVAKEMGRETRYTSSNAAEALKFLGMAGFEAAQATAALPGVLNLAAAGALDLGTAADIATNVLTAFGLEVGQLGQVNDVLVKTFTSSNVNLIELGEAFKMVGPVAKGVGSDFEDLIGTLGALGNAGIKGCYDDQTKVLTKRGFIYWEDATINDEYFTLNPKTYEIEYQKPSGMYRYKVNEKMLKIKTKHIDLKITKEHNMFVKKQNHENYELISAENIYNKNVKFKKSGIWKGYESKKLNISGFKQNRGNYIKNIPDLSLNMDNWLKFYGLFITDGSLQKVQKGNYTIVISQRKQQIRNKIEKILNQLNISYFIDGFNYKINNQQLYNHLIKFGRLKKDRFVPEYIKNCSIRQLKIFYHSVVDGDGDCSGAIYSSYSELINDFSEIILKIGWNPSIRIKTKKGKKVVIEGNPIVAKKDNYVITINKKQLEPIYDPSAYNSNTIHGQKLKNDLGQKWVDYKGYVYCAEVPNHVLCVQRNGTTVFCGNTMAGTALKNAIDSLLAPTGKEAALMKQLEGRLGGVALKVRDASGDFIGFKKVIQQLEKAGLRGDEALKAFGLRAGPALVALLNQGSEGLGDLIKKLKEAGGTSEEIAQLMEAGIGGQLRKTKSVIEAFQIALGEAFGPEVKVVLVAFRDWINKITIAVEKLKDNGGLAGWGQTIISIFSGVGFAISKTISAMSVVTSLAIAAVAAGSGDLGLANEAMKGAVTNFNKIFAVEEKVVTVTKAITTEMNAMRKELDDVNDATAPIGKGFGDVAEGADSATKAVAATTDQLSEFEKAAKKAYTLATLEADKYGKKVLEWDEKIKNLRLSTSDKLRELDRKAMGDAAAWKDRELQAEEKLVAAKKALRASDYQLAEKLAKQSSNLYASLAQEIKKTGDSDKGVWGDTIGSLKQNIDTAKDGIGEVSTFIEKVYSDQRKNDKATQKSFQELAAQAKITLDELTKKREAGIEIKLLELQKAQSILNELTKPVTKYIKIKYLKSKDPSSSEKRQKGGTIAGYGGGDKVDALLEKGEGILTKEAVKKYPGLVDLANNLRLGVGQYIPKFRYGGIVNTNKQTDQGGVSDALKGNGGSSETLVVRFQAGETEASVKVTDDDSRVAMKSMARELSRMRLVNVN